MWRLILYRPLALLRYMSGTNNYNPKQILRGLKRKVHLAKHYLFARPAATTGRKWQWQ
jgi:hypothetical protein